MVCSVAKCSRYAALLAVFVAMGSVACKERTMPHTRSDGQETYYKAEAHRKNHQYSAAKALYQACLKENKEDGFCQHGLQKVDQRLEEQGRFEKDGSIGFLAKIRAVRDQLEAVRGSPTLDARNIAWAEAFVSMQAIMPRDGSQLQHESLKSLTKDMVFAWDPCTQYPGDYGFSDKRYVFCPAFQKTYRLAAHSRDRPHAMAENNPTSPFQSACGDYLMAQQQKRIVTNVARAIRNSVPLNLLLPSSGAYVKPAALASATDQAQQRERTALAGAQTMVRTGADFSWQRSESSFGVPYGGSNICLQQVPSGGVLIVECTCKVGQVFRSDFAAELKEIDREITEAKTSVLAGEVSSEQYSAYLFLMDTMKTRVFFDEGEYTSAYVSYQDLVGRSPGVSGAQAQLSNLLAYVLPLLQQAGAPTQACEWWLQAPSGAKAGVDTAVVPVCSVQTPAAKP